MKALIFRDKSGIFHQIADDLLSHVRDYEVVY